MNPKYPMYVISKGRAYNLLTCKILETMRVPYRLVIEPQEYDAYAAVVDNKKILVLPFSDLGLGSIPARNWIWELALSKGFAWHWILDDNIRRFYRYNMCMRLEVETGAIFRAAEDFVERYENVAVAGFQYKMFLYHHFWDNTVWPAFILNTRVYSCILIRNDLPHRWRGRYNEDTDLSLRVLKDGWCTVLFQAFLADKIATMHMRGGNMEQLYQRDGRLKMARSLINQHPDVTRLSYRFHRWQHVVNYRRFKHNKLRFKPGVRIEPGVNNYGMVLKTFPEDED